MIESTINKEFNRLNKLNDKLNDSMVNIEFENDDYKNSNE